jgi:hypothetical protein
MGELLNRAVKLVKRPSNKDEVIFKSGTTENIIEVVLMADKEAAKERFLKRFAESLRGKTDFDTCRNVWRFVRQEIPYKGDKLGYERIKLPNKTIHDAAKGIGTDCKSMSVLGNDLLRELGIGSKYRFISQNSTAKATHVYSMALLKNGLIVPCDAVFYLFNQKPPQTYNWDFDAAGFDTEGVKGLNYSTNNFSIF